MNTTWKTILGTGLAAALVACGGGGGGSGGGSDGYGTTGELNLAITDAPVDGASAVWVTITGMKLKRTEDNDEKTVTLNGADTVDNKLRVNLLDLNGLDSNSGLPVSKALFADRVTAGNYQWIRFQVEDACIVFETDPSTCEPLGLPAQDELKTAGSFNVPSNGVANITVDWDLRKSIVEMGNNSGNYKLKPVLHLKDTEEVGSISGEVSLVTSTTCASDDDRAIYVFNGSNITPDDIDGTGVEPIASVYVKDDDSFFVGMLDAGVYTLAFTCDADLDELTGDDTTVDEATGVNFPEKVEVEVTAGVQTTNVFIPTIPTS